MLTKKLKFLASLKLAVLVIVSIAIITAIGTFVEAKYDAHAAKKLVYDSVYMLIIMSVFAVNLTAVMVDRWPWKLKHASFICAHVGILMIMAGQLMTTQWGKDGSMRVGINEENRFISLPQTDIVVYASFDGTNYTKLFEQEVDFFKNSPSPEDPFVILKQVNEREMSLKFTDHHKYALSSRETLDSDNPKLGSGVRFQLTNGQANFIEWLVQRSPTHVASLDIGPLKVHLGRIPEVGTGANEIYMLSENGKIKYALFGKGSLDPKKEGVIEEGKAIDTGWMGLEFRILRYLSKADEQWKIEGKERPTPLTTEAVEVEFEGKRHWMLLNDTVKFFSNDVVYFVSYANRRFDIGFPIFLNEFIMDKYQGTARAASYRSIVTVPGLGTHEISMNEPLKHMGLTVYQASFQDGPMGNPIASVFSINQDPGRFLKYLGSLVMTLGIILLFFLGKKLLAKLLSEVVMKLIMGLFICLIGLNSHSAYLSDGEALRALPVQADGRVKPYDSFAREMLEVVYGKQRFEKRDAYEIIMTWMLAPEAWQTKELFEVKNYEVLTKLGLDPKKRYYRGDELFSAVKFSEIRGELNAKRETKEKLTPYFQALQRLENQFFVFSEIASGRMMRVVPPAQGDAWVSIADLQGDYQSRFFEVTKAFISLVGARAEGKSQSELDPLKAELDKKVIEFEKLAATANPALYPSETKINLEIHYNLFHPFRWSYIFYLLSAVFVLFAWITSSSKAMTGAWVLTGLAFILHTYGFLLRSYLMDRAPVTNMYETVVWVAWGSIVFAAILERIYKFKFILLAGALVAAFGMIIADSAPVVLDPSLQPLEPVLRSNYWLTIHVMTITISYSAFFLAFALGDIGLIYYLKDEVKHRDKIKAIVMSIYRSKQIGVVFLAPGIILGGIWADYSWGRFWGWDPKETWALIALLGYMAVLHGRLTGWIKDFGMIVSGVLTFSLVIMAWYGVNFVLGAGLHSYGFGAGGVEYVTGFVLLHVLFVVYVAVLRNSRAAKSS